jgi:hypothetical protein
MNERKYVQTIHPVRGRHPKYARNAYNLIAKEQKTQLKMGKGHK